MVCPVIDFEDFQSNQLNYAATWIFKNIIYFNTCILKETVTIQFFFFVT